MIIKIKLSTKSKRVTVLQGGMCQKNIEVRRKGGGTRVCRVQSKGRSGSIPSTRTPPSPHTNFLEGKRYIGFHELVSRNSLILKSFNSGNFYILPFLLHSNLVTFYSSGAIHPTFAYRFKSLPRKGNERYLQWARTKVSSA